MSGWHEDNVDELTSIIKNGFDSISGSLEEVGGAFAILNHRLSGTEDQVERVANGMSMLAEELARIFEPIGNLHMSIADDIRKIADEIEEQGQ